MFDLLKRSSADLAIDLGTANTVVYVRGEGIVFAEPSVVALETLNGRTSVRAVGDDAKLMMGKTPDNIRTIRPLRNGVIADIEIAEQMIKHFIQKAHGGRSRFAARPEMAICVPSGSTQVERRAIKEAVSQAGAGKVWLIDEPLAAAIGADLPVNEPTGSMVVDIGGGTTEVGIISVQGLAMTMSVRVGGDRMDEAITASVRRNHNLIIGEATSERVKKEYGAAWLAPGQDPAKVRVRGREVSRGIPMEILVDQAELVTALSEPVGQIIEAVRIALENTAPEIAADIIDAGIVMTGGGSLLPGIDELLSKETGLAVSIAESPLDCVALGAGRALTEDAYRGALRAA
ncbi:rod shape-determining protein MreB [Aurantiacibacter atlanticus]|uniref:Cell shape-determining protein MreB n=1 Tax=Aurantiacibacter atlanticus TaxID=1648404 RepID=A0A0H4VDZ6_9SPHN|nr:rod shape-determining protein [Aurantiacibacter atlanticus]AKQ41314.1 rod shape-determining protein MreB [Aurantiacibacter atlanticus]MDF1834601.1 rod shape-determining protein [Alteraurantiacibacter sp. bin_em_oilr2.035]